MSSPVKVPTVTQYIRKQHEELRKFLDSGDSKVKVEGFPRRLLFGLVDVTPLLCDYIEDLQVALQVIAEPPSNGCPACVSASQLAQAALSGKKTRAG